MADSGLTEGVGLVHIDALRRHSLINGDNATYLGSVDPFHAIQLSPYGWAFVQACLPPGVIEDSVPLTAVDVMRDSDRFHVPSGTQTELEELERDIANDARGA